MCYLIHKRNFNGIFFSNRLWRIFQIHFFYSETHWELYFCKLRIKMQSTTSSLQDAKVIFLYLEYIFLRSSWEEFFLERMQDLRLSYTWQNIQNWAAIVLNWRSLEYFIRVEDGIIFPHKLLIDNNNSRKSISECFIFCAFTAHIFFKNTFWYTLKKHWLKDTRKKKAP